MAAYGALVSLMHIIEQLEHHPRPPVTLDKQQVQSLTEKVVFLQEFLEGYSHVAGYSKDADALESWIAEAAYVAEDIIEAHIVDKILTGSTSHGKNISSNDIYEGLQALIEEMDSIKKEVMETRDKMGVHDQLQRSSMLTESLRSTSTGQNTMVGFDDVCLQIMDKLTRGKIGRQIMPIVGMGGIGKTTLAKSIYQNQVVVEHFDILVWVTISQEYQMTEILLELLQKVGGNLSQELGHELYKKLSGRRYLIIMDDIWNIEVWDELKFFFPDNNNGSRIILTTRLLNLASHVANADDIKRMAFLDEGNSWNLFSKTVFGEKRCPLELEEKGKKIVKNCKGLPLSIVVIGGLLAKSKHTREYWEYIAKNLNSVVNSEDDENCSKILRLSYNHLPVYLKPCFLYMGIFPEDNEIPVSRLIKLWVAEGFLKPRSGKPLEEIAKGYLEELIDRNLILVHKLGSTGNIKYCKIHDLLRDLCLTEAQKERFCHVTWQHSLKVPPGLNTDRRLLVVESTSEEEVHDALQPVSLVRSLMSKIDVDLQLENFRLLRIITGSIQRAYSKEGEYFCSYGTRTHFPGDLFQLVNARYLEAKILPNCPFSVCLLWNLQTLILSLSHEPSCIDAPAEIWNMPQLRHVICRTGLSLPDPPSGNDSRRIVLENLQTLVTIINLKCGEEVIKRIPNIVRKNR